MNLKRILLSTPMFFAALAAGLAGAASLMALAGTAGEPKPEKLAAVTTAQSPLPILSPAAVATPLPLADGDPANSNGEDVRSEPMEIDWGGYYNFGDAESLPKAFRDLRYVEIELYDLEKMDDVGNPGAPIPPKGYLRAEREFKFKRIAIAGKQIAFQTETIKGVSYRFTGKQLALDYCETDGDTPDVAGELIKIVNGKWAASIKAELYEECGC
ncbi:MAG: hypothetical protein AB7F88_01820 [Pyrinomonadaceae bacterium]